jgi:cytochrome c oxidase cbb3-type subunit 4
MDLDLGVMRGGITILTLLAFLGICWWAYRPSSRRRFEQDALLPFEEHEGVLARPQRLDEANEKELS